MFSGSLLDILSLSNIEFPAASTLENVNYISTLAIEKASILPKEFLVSTKHKELTGFYQTSLGVQTRFLTRKKTKGFFSVWNDKMRILILSKSYEALWAVGCQLPLDSL